VKLARVRHDYRHPAPLREASAPGEPLALFRRWMRAALAARFPEPTAAALATAGADGRPDVRFVLVKGADARGFTFFTHHASAKGRALAARPRAAIALWWPLMARQVRVTGRVSRVSDAESDAYFALRPRGAQIGAWASRQSRAIASREALVGRAAAVRRRFAGREVPRPSGWGGYRIAPERIEFWQGRPDRMHDRLLYVRRAGRWTRRRLAP
jgi:pyridoxamine 5'-phosphate oxidase